VLLWLSDYLAQYYRGFGVFHYLTLRAIMGALTALGISLLLGPGVSVASTHCRSARRYAATGRSRT